MRALSALLIALLVFVSLPLKSHAAGYSLSVDKTGALPGWGHVNTLSNGNIQVIGILDQNYYLYDSKMNLLSQNKRDNNHGPVTELSGNRTLLASGSSYSIINNTNGSTLSSGVAPISILTAIELNNGNILISNNNKIALVDRNLQIIQHITHNEYQTIGMAKAGGKIITVAKKNLDGNHYLAQVYENADMVISNTIVPDITVQNIAGLDGDKIIVNGLMPGSGDYSYIYDDDLNLIGSGKLSLSHIPTFSFLPVGDGNFMHIGTMNNTQYGIEIVNSSGDSLQTVINNNIVGISRLSSGRIMMLSANAEYTIYKTPTGTATDDVTTAEVPYDLKNIGTTDNPIVTWKPDVMNDISHYEVYLDNALTAQSVLQNNYEPVLSTPKTYKMQVLSVDTKGKKTELSQPLFLNNSQPTTPTPTPTPTDNPIANIHSGQLLTDTSALTFSDVTISNKDPMISKGSTQVQINDSRGKGAGWSIQLSVTDFISDNILNPSGVGTIKVTIPASSVGFSTNGIAMLAGQNVDSSKMTLSPSGTLSNVAQPLINASPGSGMGIYNFGIDYEIDVPMNVMVSEITDPNQSTLQIGDTVGIFAGSYTSTFTYTTGVGL